jgi:hypothetical protein
VIKIIRRFRERPESGSSKKKSRRRIKIITATIRERLKNTMNMSRIAMAIDRTLHFFEGWVCARDNRKHRAGMRYRARVRFPNGL